MLPASGLPSRSRVCHTSRMSEQAAPGGGNEGAPSLGDVRFEDDVLMTFDGTSWIPMTQIPDTDTNRFLLRTIWARQPSGSVLEDLFGPGQPATQPAGDRDDHGKDRDDPAGTAGHDTPGQ